MKVGEYTYGHNENNHISLRGGGCEIGKFLEIKWWDWDNDKK